MTSSAKNILESFDELPEVKKQEVALAILRRTLRSDSLPLSDDDLVIQAEEISLDLDKREASDGKS
jgi:hypothetical protein